MTQRQKTPEKYKTMNSSLLKIIQENAIQTDNKCGLSVTHLVSKSGLSIMDVNVGIQELISSKEVHMRAGIHGNLFFKSQDHEL